MAFLPKYIWQYISLPSLLIYLYISSNSNDETWTDQTWTGQNLDKTYPRQTKPRQDISWTDQT